MTKGRFVHHSKFGEGQVIDQVTTQGGHQVDITQFTIERPESAGIVVSRYPVLKVVPPGQGWLEAWPDYRPHHSDGAWLFEHGAHQHKQWAIADRMMVATAGWMKRRKSYETLPNGVALIQFEGKEKLNHEPDHGDMLNAIRRGLMTSEGKFKSAVLLQESWVSTVDKNANPEIPHVRPRDDPKRTSAVMVMVYTINRAGKFVDVPELGKRYAMVGEKRIVNTGIKMEDVRLHPER